MACDHSESPLEQLQVLARLDVRPHAKLLEQAVEAVEPGRHGVQLRRLPDDVLIELRRISDEVVAELGQTDEITARVYESWKSFKDGAMNYNRIAEEALIEARKLPSN